MAERCPAKTGTISFHKIRKVVPKATSEAEALALLHEGRAKLKNISTYFWTEAVLIEAVTQDAMSIRLLPRRLRTPAVCLAAVKSNPEALHYVPVDRRSPEVCLEAVQQDGKLFLSVPKASKTIDVCLAAVESNPESIKDVPAKIKTPEFCVKAACVQPKVLTFMPQNLKPATEKSSGASVEGWQRKHRAALLAMTCEAAEQSLERWLMDSDFTCSTERVYRISINNCLKWLRINGRSLLTEANATEALAHSLYWNHPRSAMSQRTGLLAVRSLLLWADEHALAFLPQPELASSFVCQLSQKNADKFVAFAERTGYTPEGLLAMLATAVANGDAFFTSLIAGRRDAGVNC